MLRFYNDKKDSFSKQIVFYANLLVFIISSGYLGVYYYNNSKNQNNARAVTNQIGQIKADDLQKADDGTYLDRYASLRDKYPDLVGQITYDYYNEKRVLPVMQTENNTDYIYSDVLGQDSDAGTPFVDYRCDVKNSLITIIYAHNMSDLSQFGALKMYKKSSYWEEHKTVVYETKYKEPVECEVVAAFYSQIYVNGEDVFKYYKYFSLDDKETYDYYVKNCKALAQYDTGITPKYGEKLLVLSTCDKEQKIPNGHGRFALLCRITDTSIEDNSEHEYKTEEIEKNEETNADEILQNSSENDNLQQEESEPTPEPVRTKKPTKKPEKTKSPVVEEETPKPTRTPKPVDTPEPSLEPTPEPVLEIEESSSDSESEEDDRDRESEEESNRLRE